MIKAGDKVFYEQFGNSIKGTVKTGPYPKEFQALYPDNTPTTFIDDAYDLQIESDGSLVEGVRRRYLKKNKEAIAL